MKHVAVDQAEQAALVSIVAAKETILTALQLLLTRCRARGGDVDRIEEIIAIEQAQAEGFATALQAVRAASRAASRNAPRAAVR